MDTPAAEQVVQVPPCPPWVRADLHRRFWMAVARADDRERLPDSVFDEAPTDATEAEDDAEERGAGEDLGGGAGGG